MRIEVESLYCGLITLHLFAYEIKVDTFIRFLFTKIIKIHFLLYMYVREMFVCTFARHGHPLTLRVARWHCLLSARRSWFQHRGGMKLGSSCLLIFFVSACAYSEYTGFLPRSENMQVMFWDWDSLTQQTQLWVSCHGGILRNEASRNKKSDYNKYQNSPIYP